MLRFARSLAVLLVLVLFSIPVAEAQIEITESDARGFVGERVALQVYTATSPSSFSSFFDQDGENLTFDFTPYNYQILFSGFQEAWEAQNAPSDVPFLTHFTDRGANVVVETRFEAEHSEEADSSSWQFFEITSSQEAFHGFGAVYNQDLDQDGEQPDSVRAQWSPARIAATLPLTYEDTWEQKTDLSFSAAFPTLSSDRENEITGWDPGDAFRVGRCAEETGADGRYHFDRRQHEHYAVDHPDLQHERWAVGGLHHSKRRHRKDHKR